MFRYQRRTSPAQEPRSGNYAKAQERREENLGDRMYGEMKRVAAEGSTRDGVDKLQSQRASKLELKAEQVVEALRKIALSSMLDYMTPDEDGELHLDFSKVTHDQAAAIQEVRQGSRKDSKGRIRRAISLRSKSRRFSSGSSTLQRTLFASGRLAPSTSL